MNKDFKPPEQDDDFYNEEVEYTSEEFEKLLKEQADQQAWLNNLQVFRRYCRSTGTEETYHNYLEWKENEDAERLARAKKSSDNDELDQVEIPF